MDKNSPDGPDDGADKDIPRDDANTVNLNPGDSVSIELPNGGGSARVVVNVVGGNVPPRPGNGIGSCVWSIFQGCGCLVLLAIVIAVLGSFAR